MKRFSISTLNFALLHYLALLCVRGSEFIVAHIPPLLINLDWLVLSLLWVEKVLIAPRLLLRALLPMSNNVNWLIWLLIVVNSLVWGMALASATRHRQITKRKSNAGMIQN